MIKTISLARSEFLSERLDYLPHGIIDKKTPGIGATTLEFKCDRHSIVVAPTKFLAYNKAVKHNAIYVGSEIGIIKQPISINDIVTSIETELNSNNKVKISVVADSLSKVIEAVNSSSLNLEDCFLMFDEIDTYQMDSIFRSKLEDVVDHYFNHPPTLRCMISATILPFSDPRLSQQEPRTTIELSSARTREINLIHSTNVNRACAQLIEAKLEKTTDNIVIAYNSIDHILEIISLLLPEYQKMCSIACSVDSKDKAASYFKSIDSSGKLDSRVTFITSTYFNGIDITDEFHIISVINQMAPFTLLSEQRLFQIQGRGRNGVKSETIIQDSHEQKTPKELISTNEKFSKLLETANRLIACTECVTSHFPNDSFNLAVMNSLRQAITNCDIENSRLLRFDLNNDQVIAHFNIDSMVEQHRIKTELYGEKNQLKNRLESQGHNIKCIEINPEYLPQQAKIRKGLKDKRRTIDKETMSEAIKSFQDLPFKLIPNQAHSLTGPQRELADRYIEVGKYFKDPKQSLSYFEKYPEKRQFNKFLKALTYESLPQDHVFKKKMLQEFNIDKAYTPDQILKKINKIYGAAEIGLPQLAKDKQKTAVNHLKSYFKCKRSISKKHTRGAAYAILISGTNPLNLNGVQIQSKHHQLQLSFDFFKTSKSSKQLKTAA
ncbi:hypothetical protein GYB22_12670 [bacterium]|nr:hypothetical protein [bacterium]